MAQTSASPMNRGFPNSSVPGMAGGRRRRSARRVSRKGKKSVKRVSRKGRKSSRKTRRRKH